MDQTGVAAIILAAGRGERAGQPEEGPKQYRRLGAETVLRRTLRCFADHPAVGRIVTAIHPDDLDLYQEAAAGLGERLAHVTGGASRQSSTRNALKFLDDAGVETVLIHDGARPFVDKATIDAVIAAVRPDCGGLPALAVSDTLKTADADGLVDGTVPRGGLFAAQTPQGFPYRVILDAHERAFEAGIDDFTDDSAIAEWAGLRVRIVTGSAENTKLTWARDLEMANARVAAGQSSWPDVRTGNGYDVHCFGPGDHVTLCGVEIAHPRTLSGHSDADVGLHALTDALLATCGAGDIGTHFPPSDMQWKGAASHIFVAEAVRIVRQRGGRVANADITLICEAPKIGPHRDAMVARLGEMLGVTPDRVSVKATTNERLGFIGREEGIAAIATATVIFPGGVPG